MKDDRGLCNCPGVSTQIKPSANKESLQIRAVKIWWIIRDTRTFEKNHFMSLHFSISKFCLHSLAQRQRDFLSVLFSVFYALLFFFISVILMLLFVWFSFSSSLLSYLLNSLHFFCRLAFFLFSANLFRFLWFSTLPY